MPTETQGETPSTSTNNSEPLGGEHLDSSEATTHTYVVENNPRDSRLEVTPSAVDQEGNHVVASYNFNFPEMNERFQNEISRDLGTPATREQAKAFTPTVIRDISNIYEEIKPEDKSNNRDVDKLKDKMDQERIQHIDPQERQIHLQELAQMKASQTEYENGLKKGRALTPEEVGSIAQKQLETNPNYVSAKYRYSHLGLKEDQVNWLLIKDFDKEIKQYAEHLIGKGKTPNSRNLTYNEGLQLVEDHRKQIGKTYAENKLSQISKERNSQAKAEVKAYKAENPGENKRTSDLEQRNAQLEDELIRRTTPPQEIHRETPNMRFVNDQVAFGKELDNGRRLLDSEVQTLVNSHMQDLKQRLVASGKTEAEATQMINSVSANETTAYQEKLRDQDGRFNSSNLDAGQKSILRQNYRNERVVAYNKEKAATPGVEKATTPRAERETKRVRLSLRAMLRSGMAWTAEQMFKASLAISDFMADTTESPRSRGTGNEADTLRIRIYTNTDSIREVLGLTPAHNQANA
jgi:hypothetical protein